MSTGSRIAVVGTGGIGAYYVARLAAAGADPLAVARGEHLAAIRRHGLQVEHPQHPFHGPVDACDTDGLAAEDPRAFAAVVLLTKATATASIATRLRAWLGDAHAMFELIHAFPPIRASMLVDLDRGRAPETDAIYGAVLRRAGRHGIDTPVLRTVSTLLAVKLARG